MGFWDTVEKISQVDERSLKKHSKSRQWQNDTFNRMKSGLNELECRANKGDETAQKALINVYKGEFKHLARNIFAKDKGEAVKSINFLAIELVDAELKNKLVDLNKSFKWCKVLVDKGHKSARLWICDYYINGITDNANDGVICYKNLYKEGYPSCAYSLAKIYHYGQGGIAKNISEAAKWYKKAADEGIGHHEEAKYELALMYLKGKGVKKNHNKAVKLFKELYSANPTGYWGCGAEQMLKSIENNGSQESKAEQGGNFFGYLLIGLLIYFVIKFMYPY